MAQKIFVFMALAFALATLVASAPSPIIPVKRDGTNSGFVDGQGCTGDTVLANVGDFFAIDSTGSTIACSDVDTSVSAANGDACYQYTQKDKDKGNLGSAVKCPGDPAPAKNPDGSTQSTGATDYCTISTEFDAPLPIAFAGLIGCLIFGHWEANGDPGADAEAGAIAVCDSIFLGACTFFTEVAPELEDKYDACYPAKGADYGYSSDAGICAFANPGK